LIDLPRWPYFSMSGTHYYFSRSIEVPLPARNSRSRWFAWWYFAIALGFLLLAINKALTGEKAWLIALRSVIALGFAALGYAELRSSARK